MFLNIFSNFNYPNLFLNNPYTFMGGGFSAPTVFMPMGAFYPSFNMPNFSSIFNFGKSYTPATVQGQGTSATGADVTNRGYNPDALKALRNASILKNVPESRKTAILDIVDRAAKQYNIDPKFILSIIYAESGFDPSATSPCGAMGLMQLMPGTAKQFGASNPYDMEQNIFAGTKFLSSLIKRYNGNISLAAAAYNAGPGRVKDSVPKIKQTQNYVAKVTRTLSSLG